MYWLVTIWLSNIISTKGFVIQDTFNVLLKDDADYKVDLVITADDYEMIDQNQLKPFQMEKERGKFRELDDMARMEISQESKIKAKNVSLQNVYLNLPIIVVNNDYNNSITTYVGPLTVTRTIYQNRKRAIKTNESDYDYDDLVDEYYDQSNNESRSKNAYHIRKSAIELTEYGAITSFKRIFSLTNGNINCSETKGIGLAALKCLYDDYKGERQSTRDVLQRLWKIFQIWFLVYLAVAIPLWCTRDMQAELFTYNVAQTTDKQFIRVLAYVGWCCCCLWCKFFKPRQTIEEAKRYVVLYPPGVFKTKNGDIRYEPTEREKECYEEFEHFIKTL